MTQYRFCRVAVALPVNGPFTYKTPKLYLDYLQPGHRVLVPFGNRRVTGYVIELCADPGMDESLIKPIIQVLDTEPVFDKIRLELFNFISDYYIQPLGEVIKTGLPAGINTDSKISWTITEEGIEALNSPGISTRERAILLCLEPGRSYNTKRLISRCQSANPPSLKKLSETGWIHKLDMLEEASTKTKFINAYSVSDKTNPVEILDSLSKAPKQLEVFRTLLNMGQVDVNALSLIIKSPQPALTALVKKGLVQVSKKECYRNSETGFFPDKENEIILNREQKEAFKEIKKAVEKAAYSPYLIHGITGSGKTEVYIQLAKVALDMGKKVLILVPEIALTPLLVSRFVKRFGARVAVSHSGLSNTERYDQWRRMARQEADLCVGTRSAVFSPLGNLGLIVVDEEHDTSYKQDTGTPYNGRDIALVLGKASSCPVVLGSATPSLESYNQAKNGKYKLLEITKRATAGALPEVEIVNLAIELKKSKMRKKKSLEKKESDSLKKLPTAKYAFSRKLKTALARTLRNRKQAILFLNRRGYSTHSFCLECKRPVMCPNCDVSLTPHFNGKELICHYCDFKMRAETVCPHCGGMNFFLAGLGTEQVEKSVAKNYPGARVARLDKDTTGPKGSLEKILIDFGKGKYDILVGTQIVTKGHDFSNVTLVGVLCADSSMYMPDFRGAEKTFQLLSQVAGRAGRGNEPGKVIIQTFNPDHYSIKAAQGHDFQDFFKMEIERRASPLYPPFVRVALMRSRSKTKNEARAFLIMVANNLRQWVRDEKIEKVIILGPAQSALSKIQGHYRFKLLVKAPSPGVLNLVMRKAELIAVKWKHGDIDWKIDIDPQSVL